MRLRLLWGIVLITTLVGCQDRPEGVIAYLLEQNDVGHIYLMNADGTDNTRLYTGLVEDGCPVWSPDGNRLLFVSVNGTEFTNREANIYVFAVQEETLEQLTFGQSEVYEAAWSPDGSQIVYAAGKVRSGFINLFLMDSDGTNSRQITFGDSRDLDPDWSPDGNYILYTSNKGERIREENLNFDIYRLDLATLQSERLIDHAEDDYQPDPPREYEPTWLPDGTGFVFYTIQSNENHVDKAEIFLSNSASTEVSPIIQSTAPYLYGSADVAPNGDFIAFVSNRDRIDAAVLAFDIFITDLAGSQLTKLTATDSENNLCPNWQPINP